MFRNIYDMDCITWNPKGKVMQIEYAKEAVKQGMMSLGLKSKTHVVLVSLKRNPDDLSDYQEKIFEVDEHIGIAISGLLADARNLCEYMRQECLNYWYMHDSQHPIARLIAKVGEKNQHKTIKGHRRPYGVGILAAGYDSSGTHLFETQPSGEYFEYYGMAIGARSQSAKTYLEKNIDKLPESSLEDLVKIGVGALRASAQEMDLTEENVSIGIVGKDTPFHKMAEEDIKKCLGENEDVEMQDA
jgi:20S proteasome subunit alpha 6